MTRIPRGRRLLCAAVSVAVAGLLFRGQLADALVTRGDDAFRSGDIPAALRTYDRALRIDPRSTVAADRLAFFLALQHDPENAQRAVRIASDALQVQRTSPLFADRGFAEMQLHRWPDAERDFATAGALGRDARYHHLAARMALRRGDRPAARADAARALLADPNFAPARALLRRLD
jgi:tetratricopeptide (TPR) repeat protein